MRPLSSARWSRLYLKDTTMTEMHQVRRARALLMLGTLSATASWWSAGGAAPQQKPAVQAVPNVHDNSGFAAYQRAGEMHA